MKQTLNFSILLFLFIGITITSCEKDETTKQIDENQISKNLTFIDINSRLESYGLKEGVIIVQWNEWGRKKKDCDGWGLCNAEWFPAPEEKSSGLISTNPNGGSSILEYNPSTDQYYIDILLAAALPDIYTIDDVTLIVDEEIELLNINTVISRNLSIPIGDYTLNNSLGNFGGYRIYLD